MTKAKRGRPTKYKDSYPALLERMLKKGEFNETFMAKVGIHSEAFYAWVKKYPDFSNALKAGSEASKALFMKKTSAAAWDTVTHKVNNGLISLLAVNVHKMSTGKELPPSGEGETDSFNVEVTVRKKVE